MIKKTITKKLIIKALKTEPLSRNYVFDLYTNYVLGVMDCKVCAVGAILRKSLGENLLRDISKTMESYLSVNIANEACRTIRLSHHDPKRLVNEGLYLAALSNFFESSESDDKNGNISRRKLINFVNKYFPNKITYTLNLV